MNKTIITLIILYLNVFIISSSNTFVLPFLPIYLKDELNCSSSTLSLYTTLCYTVTFIVTVFISPVWGHFADKLGKKKMLIRVSFILFISYILAYAATTPLMLCISRTIQGFACGMMPTIMAFTSSLSDEKKKTELRIGYMQSVNLLGTIVGPALGGVMAEFFGVRMSYFCIFILILSICIINAIILKEPVIHCRRKCTKEILPVKNILKDPIIQSLCCCIIVNSAVIMMVVPILAEYVASLTSFKEPLALSGIIFSLSGIAGVLASPLWSRYGSENGFLKVLIGSSIGAAIAYLLQFFTDSVVVFSLLQFIFGLCICATIPAANSITAKHVHANSQTKAFSVLYSASQLGNILGPIISTSVTLLFAPKFVFLFSSVILFLIFSYLFIVFNLRNYEKNNS